MKKSSVVHPKRYMNTLTGTVLDTEKVQMRYRWLVENYCRKCTMYEGKNHDFRECCTQKGKMLTKCPKVFGKIVIPDDKDIEIACVVEE